jgi:hypothetical protein
MAIGSFPILIEFLTFSIYAKVAIGYSNPNSIKSHPEYILFCGVCADYKNGRACHTE